MVKQELNPGLLLSRQTPYYLASQAVSCINRTVKSTVLEGKPEKIKDIVAASSKVF